MTRRRLRRAPKRASHPFAEPLPDASRWLHHVHPRFDGESLESRMVKAALIRDGYVAASHLARLRDCDIDALPKHEKELIRHLLRVLWAGMAVGRPIEGDTP